MKLVAFTLTAAFMLFPTSANLPKLPPAFSTIVEANILNTNSTLIMEETFDFNQAKSFRKLKMNSLRSMNVNIAEFYDTEQSWVWTQTASSAKPLSCTVNRVSPFEFDLHGLHGTPSVNQFFGVSNRSAIVSNGTGTARGIPCDVWHQVSNVTFNEPVGTSTLTVRVVFDVFYYFSRTPWTWFRPETQIPVRIIIRGYHDAKSANVSLNDFHTFEHYYEFVEFEVLTKADFTGLFSPVSAANTHFCNVKPYCSATPNSNALEFCSPTRGPPMPTFPATFSCDVEANFVNRNFTMNIFEAFDNEHKLFHFRQQMSQFTHAILADTAHNEVWEWDYLMDSNTPLDCNVSPLDRVSLPTLGELFGQHTHDHGGSAYSSADFFTFGNATEVYIGQSSVRGVAVHGWYRQIVQIAPAFHPPHDMEEYIFDAFYYWSESQWTYGHLMSKMVPVRVSIQGTARDLVDNHTHTFEHVYDYFNFRRGHNESLLDESFNHDSTHNANHAGHDEAHEFLPPIDWIRQGICNTSLYCSGATPRRSAVCTPAPKPFPTLPATYSTDIEANFMNANYTLRIFEAFDDVHQVFHTRTVGHQFTHRVLADMTTNETWLWDTGVHSDNLLECHVTTAIRSHNPSLVNLMSHSHEGHAYTSKDILFFGRQFPARYVGESLVRGIQVEGWHRHIVMLQPAFHAPHDMERMTFDAYYYFSVPTWRFGHLATRSVPVRVHITGSAVDLVDHHTHSFEHIYDYVNFRAGHNESLLEESFNHDTTHDETHAGHDEAHEFLPPISWVRQCNTSSYCANSNSPRPAVCAPGPAAPGAVAANPGTCTQDNTAAIAVGVTLGFLLLVSWCALWYVWSTNRGTPKFSRTESESQKL